MIKVVVLMRGSDTAQRKELATFYHPHPELLTQSPFITIDDDPPYVIWGAYNKIETFDNVPQPHYVIIVHYPEVGKVDETDQNR